MKKFTGISIVLVLGVAAGIAQNPCARAAQLTDQKRFVQREIQERIDESIEAAEANDLSAKTLFRSRPNSELVDGTVLDRKQLKEGMKRDSEWILSVSDQTSVTIECLEMKGSEAVLITDQHFVRTVPDRKGGSPHELITNAKHRETWVYTKAGWLTERIEELNQGPTYLDGRLFEE